MVFVISSLMFLSAVVGLFTILILLVAILGDDSLKKNFRSFFQKYGWKVCTISVALSCVFGIIFQIDYSNSKQREVPKMEDASCSGIIISAHPIESAPVKEIRFVNTPGFAGLEITLAEEIIIGNDRIKIIRMPPDEDCKPGTNQLIITAANPPKYSLRNFGITKFADGIFYLKGGLPTTKLLE